MTPETIQNAVEHVQEQIDSGDYGFSTADEECFQVLFELAKCMLIACEAMPLKRIEKELAVETEEQRGIRIGFNTALSVCTFSFAKIIFELNALRAFILGEIERRLEYPNVAKKLILKKFGTLKI